MSCSEILSVRIFSITLLHLIYFDHEVHFPQTYKLLFPTKVTTGNNCLFRAVWLENCNFCSLQQNPGFLKFDLTKKLDHEDLIWFSVSNSLNRKFWFHQSAPQSEDSNSYRRIELNFCGWFFYRSESRFS